LKARGGISGLYNEGFRALKAWMMLQQAGKTGYQHLIRRDIELASLLANLVIADVELECISVNLSICTFRYIPNEIGETSESYYNRLNESILNSLQRGGKVFLSNAVVQKKYCLRICVMNFRTTEKDIAEVAELVKETGRIQHDAIYSKWMLNSGSEQ